MEPRTAAEVAEVVARQRERKAAARKVIIREALQELASRILHETFWTPEQRRCAMAQIDQHREAVIGDVGWRGVS